MNKHDSNHWTNLSSQWRFVEPPLRPATESVKTIQQHLRGHDDRVLVLGVTRELVAAFDNVTAVEKNTAVIRQHWHASSAPGKKCHNADWLTLHLLLDPQFTAVVGDGSLNNVQFPNELGDLLKIAAKLTYSSGKFACRVYLRPEAQIDDKDIAAKVFNQKINFSALKMMLAMSIAGRTNANVPVISILEEFNRLFPDREKLSNLTKWQLQAIQTIDVYEDSALIYAFPTRSELLSCASPSWKDVTFLSSGDYPLSDCCPILFATKS